MLFPDALPDVDPVDVYGKPARQRPAGRPYVLINMVVSVDGAIAIGGQSRGLSGPSDREVFRALRAVPDVVLVGSGTVQAENYGPVVLDDMLMRMRSGRGQKPLPRTAVVTGQLSVDFEGRLFAQDGPMPIVVTSRAAASNLLERAREHADVVIRGTDRVDLVSALAAIGSMSVDTILCEGGPTLNGDLLHADLVDELDLTVAPLIAGGATPSVFGSAVLDVPPEMELAHVLTDGDGHLFLRYVRRSR